MILFVIPQEIPTFFKNGIIVTRLLRSVTASVPVLNGKQQMSLTKENLRALKVFYNFRPSLLASVFNFSH